MKKYLRKLNKIKYLILNKIRLKTSKKILNIRNTEETVEKIISGYSISRYGDGEFGLIFNNKDALLQEKNKELISRLKEILNSDLEKHIIGVPESFINIRNLTKISAYFWSRYYVKNKAKLEELLSFTKEYYSSQVTRFYMPYKNKNLNKDSIEKLINYFNNKELLIIEGADTRFGIGNSLLDNVVSIERVILPSKNSFAKYKEILEYMKKNKNIFSKKLVLIALGPTATILSYDLTKEGYQAVDIGNLDIEYEWFLMKTEKKVIIPNKFVVEIKDSGNKELPEKLKKIYLSQIIEKIL